MKITKVDVFKASADIGILWAPILCRVYTDEGIYGDGEGAIAYVNGQNATFGMIKDLAPLIIGMDPLDNEVIWDKLYKATFWGQNGGPVVFSGISAIDFALWDIKGKFFGVPVYKLLGGKRRDNLRTYASQLQFGWSDHFIPMQTAEDYADVSRRAVAEGYDCIKTDFCQINRDFKPGNGLAPMYGAEDATRLLSPYLLGVVEERIAATREAIGPDVDIIMENHSTLDANSAVQLGRIAQKYGIFYYEEPNTPSPKTAKYICNKLQMPISQGERLYSRGQYAPFFEDMSIQVIQPDLGNTAGLTEGNKICDMAYVYDVCVQAHVCAGPLSTAAALHLECVIPNFVIHEHHNFCLYQANKDLCIYDYQPENGKFKVPDLPGLGNEHSEKALATEEKVTVQ